MFQIFIDAYKLQQRSVTLNSLVPVKNLIVMIPKNYILCLSDLTDFLFVKNTIGKTKIHQGNIEL